MPSVSGCALRLRNKEMRDAFGRKFLCPRCRAVLCDPEFVIIIGLPTPEAFLCPRCRAALAARLRSDGCWRTGFYALGVGLHFATVQ
jgi:hypothetical protein